MNKAKSASLLFAVLTLSACSTPQSAEFTLFEESVTACGHDMNVADEGLTLTIDMKGQEEWDGALLRDIKCATKFLQTPTYISESMYSTTALSGRQTDSYKIMLGGGDTGFAETEYLIEMSWTYHPDDGLDIIFHSSPTIEPNK